MKHSFRLLLVDPETSLSMSRPVRKMPHLIGTVNIKDYVGI